jgi:hypothetical protein
MRAYSAKIPGQSLSRRHHRTTAPTAAGYKTGLVPTVGRPAESGPEREAGWAAGVTPVNVRFGGNNVAWPRRGQRLHNVARTTAGFTPACLLCARRCTTPVRHPSPQGSVSKRSFAKRGPDCFVRSRVPTEGRSRAVPARGSCPLFAKRGVDRARGAGLYGFCRPYRRTRWRCQGIPPIATCPGPFLLAG